MLANSDTAVSVPFTRPPEFVGATTAATANTLTVSGSPWTANQFVYLSTPSQHNTYFVLIGPHSSTNPKEGRMYQITGNTTNQLTVNNGGDDISTVAATTQILVIPYHTLNSVFPASDANVSLRSFDQLCFGPQDYSSHSELQRDWNQPGAAATYAYIDWRMGLVSGHCDRSRR